MASRHGVWLLASRYAAAKAEKLERLDNAARVTYVYHLPWPECDCEMSYLVTGDGVMEITVKCQPPADAPAMPEFGLMMLIPPEYSQLEWYGDGPAETACDRRSGAKLGIFKSTVKESMTPYLIPQDAGNKTGVRWASVTDKKGQGLLFEAAAPGTMEFSALPHTPYEIENAAHHTELPPVTHTVVRASLARMGVGGDDGWGARPHPEHMLPAGVGMEFTVRVGGIL
jgi:beta-galactosidase